MKGLVSFTLFGNKKLYTEGALRNAEQWKQGPLDVDTIFYVGDSVPEKVSSKLIDRGAYVMFMKGFPEDQTATFWRWQAFGPVTGHDYDFVLSRDVDSRPSEREYFALNEWLRGSQNFHVIRDHPFHGVPILAGLFGVKKPLLPLVHELLPASPPEDWYKTVVRACNHLTVAYTSNDFYQVDQWWLRLRLYPHLRNQIMAHDSFFGFERKRFRRELPPRENNSFIAECHTENEELRHPEHRLLFNEWPQRV